MDTKAKGNRTRDVPNRTRVAYYLAALRGMKRVSRKVFDAVSEPRSARP